MVEYGSIVRFGYTSDWKTLHTLWRIFKVHYSSSVPDGLAAYQNIMIYFFEEITFVP